MKHKFGSIFLIIILICSGLLIIIPVTFITPSTKAGSIWTEESESDFKAGILNNVEVTPNGEVKLTLLSEYIKNDFNDKSEIIYENNITVKPGSSKAELKINLKTLGGPQEDCCGVAHQTMDGGYIFTAFTNSYGAGNYDIWLIKTDSNGVEQWNRTFGGSASDISLTGIQTSDGGYIIAGRTDSYGSGENDVWLIKTDSNGIEQWNKTFGADGYYMSRCVQQTSDGGYIIAGFYDITLPWGDGDVFIIKTNSSGDEQWNKTFSGDGADGVYSIQQTSDGGYIMTGILSNQITFGEVMLFKIDSNGNHTWNKTFAGGVSDESGSCVRETSDGGFIIAGRCELYDPDGDIWLIKTNSTGVEQWNKTFGGNENEYGTRVQQTSDEGYIVIGPTNTFGMGVNDIWLVKTDSNGNEQWNKTYGGESIDFGSSVLQTADGGFFVFGQTSSYGTGGRDILWFKTDSFGNCISNGSLISTNLLEGKNVLSIDSFDYQTIIPQNATIHAQFSQDNSNWYNSTGVLNGWENLSEGDHSIDLSSLNWKGSKFYYKMIFVSYDIAYVPTLNKVKLFYTQYNPSGYLVSQPFNADGDMGWKTLVWFSTEPTGTRIKFQLRTANTQTALSAKPYIGPEGNTSKYYTTSGSSIWSGHASEKWIQYKVYFETNDNLTTPILYNVTFSYNYWPEPPILMGPTDNVNTNNNKPLFTWKFNDTDSENQQAFQVLIADDSAFKNINYDSSERQSTIESWQFPTGTSYTVITDGTWYWKVRTKDNDGDWGQYSSPYKIIIDTIAPNSLIHMPLGDEFYNSLNTIFGVSSDAENGSGINRTEISIQRVSDNYYWTGLAWSADEAWLLASGFTDWKFDSSSVTWTSNTKYKVSSRAIDNAKNIEFLIQSKIFTIDFEGPLSIINIPENNSWVNRLNAISGNSIDTGGAGIRYVEISIERVNDNKYWNHNKWDKKEHWLFIEGTNQWFYNTTYVSWSTGYQYIIRSRATDNVRNNKISNNITTFMFDNLPPEHHYISINNDEKYTNSTSVILTLHAEDPDSGIYQMAFSADGETWTEWEHFATERAFTIPPGDGEKVIYFRVMDNAGNIADMVFDTILLNTKVQDNDSEKDEPLEPEEKKPEQKEDTTFTWIVTTTFIILIIIIINISLASTEVGKYKFLSLIFVPMYNKLHPDNIFNNFLRGRIYGYISAKPGENYNTIKKALKLNNGTLAHHAKVLEKEGYVYSKRDGFYTRFYPKGTEVPKFDTLKLNKTQKNLVEIIRTQPGITQHEIIPLLNKNQTFLSYNLTKLIRNNIIKLEHNGRENRYYINDDAENSYQDQTQGSDQSLSSEYMSDSESYFSSDTEVGTKKY